MESMQVKVILCLVLVIPSVLGGQEISCEKTEAVGWYYMDGLLPTCFLDLATTIDTTDAVIKSDYNATGVTFYLSKNVSYLPVQMGSVFPSLLIIQATYCAIKAIIPENFAGMKNVVRLWMSANKIETVPAGAFKEMVSLIDLDLRWNRIKQVSPDAFDVALQISLTDVKFSGNKCPNANYQSVADTLKQIEVDCQYMTNYQDGQVLGCEKTAAVPWYYMNGNIPTCYLNSSTGIKTYDVVVRTSYNASGLYIYGNKNISMLPIGLSGSFPFLLIIEATYCNLKQIGPENFFGLKYVVRLWMSANKIESIPAGTFNGLESLIDLDLRWNRINRISVTALNVALTNLNDINFKGNPCPDQNFVDIPSTIAAIEDNCKLWEKVQDGKELICERTKTVPWSYMEDLIATCFMNYATAINSNDTRIKTDYNATGLYLYNNKNITHLPIQISKTFPYLVILEASFSNVSFIGPENFAGLKYVIRLWLSGNKIEDIPSGTFKDMVSLVDLDLRWNNIQTAGLNIFVTTQIALNDIKFSGNVCVDINFTNVTIAIKEIGTTCKRSAQEVKNFDNLKTSTTSKTEAGVERLDCRRTAKNFWPYISDRLDTCLLNRSFVIKTNNSKIITDFKAKGLYMKFNKNITYLPIEMFKVFPGLIVIDSTYCSIKAIGPANFVNLKFMRFLWLGGNKIQNIPAGTFKGLVELYNIDLRGNLLKTIAADIFKGLVKLAEINIEGNPCIKKNFLNATVAMKEFAKTCKPGSNTVKSSLDANSDTKLTTTESTIRATTGQSASKTTKT